MAGTYRSQGLFVLGCVACLLLATAALIVVGPWLDRRRLARAQQYTPIQGVTARFESLCDRAGLTGRRRPRLVVAAVREAYTTVLPGGRPLVVLPLKATLAWDDPSRFDPVVLHELAHVRATPGPERARLVVAPRDDLPTEPALSVFGRSGPRLPSVLF